MTSDRSRPPRLPPRWFMRLFWRGHRGLYRLTGGRFGLWRPRANRWGTMTLRTTGRRTGRERAVIIAYIEDGQNLVALAMNGWADDDPAWWRNLQADPAATVELAHEQRRVTARAAVGDERERLWQRWRALGANLDAHAALRSSPTAVVVFEPAPTPGR